MRRGAMLPAIACLILAACSAGEEPQAADSAAAEALANASAAEPSANGLAPLTAEGWGPLKIGMTLAEVNAALGPDADPQAVGGAEPESCDQFRPSQAPEGMLVMVEQGQLTRISLIREAEVKTDGGVGLGVPAAAVRAAYGDELQVSPHKYVEAPAEYLTVWAQGGGTDYPVPGDSRGIRYEVDGTGKVAAVHAGGPSILYVEGCL